MVSFTLEELVVIRDAIYMRKPPGENQDLYFNETFGNLMAKDFSSYKQKHEHL